jgi:hypothetical protein
MDRLLTEQEISNIVSLDYGNALRHAIKAQDAKTANYYEKEVLPQKIKEAVSNEMESAKANMEIAKLFCPRCSDYLNFRIKEAEKKLIEEIEKLDCYGCKDTRCESYCHMPTKCYRWQQLKQSRGIA